MVRKAITLAAAGLVGLSGLTFTAQASAADTAAKAATAKAATKAVKASRASAPQGSSNALEGDLSTGYWLFLGFGLAAVWITYEAIDDDKDPVSP